MSKEWGTGRGFPDLTRPSLFDSIGLSSVITAPSDLDEKLYHNTICTCTRQTETWYIPTFFFFFFSLFSSNFLSFSLVLLLFFYGLYLIRIKSDWLFDWLMGWLIRVSFAPYFGEFVILPTMDRCQWMKVALLQQIFQSDWLITGVFTIIQFQCRKEFNRNLLVYRFAWNDCQSRDLMF